MGEKVDVVVSQEGRNIIRGIERRVGNDAREHQHRREAHPLVLPEEVRDGNHQREQESCTGEITLSPSVRDLQVTCPDGIFQD